MKINDTILNDCYIIEPSKFGDERGYYSPFYPEIDLLEKGIKVKGVVQGARSMSGKGIMRGLHFQKDPYSQSKIVECLRGKVLDVVVDLRKDSSSYKKYIIEELTPENGKQIFIPRGFAHGFISLEDNTLFQYLVDNDYKPSHEDGILWCDSEININWQEIFEKYGIEEPLLSEKDKKREGILEVNPNFYNHKRYLVTGVNGQLGYDVVKELNSRGIYDILDLTSNDMDITDKRIVIKIITEYAPDVVIHCAAYTNVDGAEDDKQKCYDVNVIGTKNIVDACRLADSKLIYISSDYVFDGTKDGVYEIDDVKNPVSVYGESKAISEEIVCKYDKSYVVRTSWVFGMNGKNFVKTMLKLSDNHETLRVVNDQFGSPTYTVDLAKVLVDMSQEEKYGIYHVNNEGYCSWAEFAEYIMKSNNKNTRIIPVSTEEYGVSKAKRPKNSKLSKKCLDEAGFNRLPTWQDAVDRYNVELNKNIKNEKRRVRNI